MFLLNLGYRWSFTGLDQLHGAIVLPQANIMPRIERKHPGDFQTLLFDPQLYLAGLQVEHRTRVCARLASYPWFAVEGLPEYDADRIGLKDWTSSVVDHVQEAWPATAPADISHAVQTSIECQLRLGVTSIILPCPLIDEREDEGATLGEWLDEGIRTAEKLEVPQPLLATIAISDRVLNASAFESGGFLEAIVDQVSAREGLHGVYIIVGQTGPIVHSFEIKEYVARAYMHLTHLCAEAGCRYIVTNFADLTGFVLIGLGAKAIAGGASNSLRILQLDGFRDDGGGTALPHIYSHPTASEFLTETDLDEIASRRLLRRVVDKTETSIPLFEALRRGQSASTLTRWAQSQNNLAACQQHYVERLIIEGHRYRQMNRSERLDAVIDWLEEAAANTLLIQKRLNRQVGRCPDVTLWRSLLEVITGE